MKKIIIATLLLTITFSFVYAQNDVRVYVNGTRLKEDVVLKNDQTYIPLRAVSESLGAKVIWDETTSSAYISFSEDDMIAKVVENTSPSVVTIIGNYNSSDAMSNFNNPTMHGSGVIYKNNGYIITNAHVVDDIKNLTVVLNDGTILPGQVLYKDDLADLAVVKVNKIGLTPITMASEETISGRTAIAIGTPISLTMRNTVTKGIVSGYNVPIAGSHYKLLQTDAAVNPGNSGGPLINIEGELIGIVSSKYVSESIDNTAFAIPVDTVKFAIDQFERYGKIVRPVIDFQLEQSWEAKIGLPTTKGIYVKSSNNSALINGDAIISVNGIKVHSIADWNEAIKNTYNGSTLKVQFIRNEVTSEIEIQG